MFRFCIGLFLLLSFHLHASWFSRSPKLTDRAKKMQTLLEGVDARIDDALKAFNVPGMAIGVVADGALIYSKGFGVRNLEKKEKVTPHTLFAIGSCTKAFTTFAFGTLVDEGFFSWDERILNTLPDFRLWDPYATQSVTFRDLLTHRTGMPRHDYMWYNSQLSRDEIIYRLRYLEPSCEIRERYQYNNLMYLAVAYAMEQKLSKSWEEIVKERIFAPLGMKESNFSIEKMQKSVDYALPYIEKKGVLKQMGFRDISNGAPVGGINANVHDLAKWMELLLNGGEYQDKRLISPATLQECFAPQVIVGGAPDTKETKMSAYGMGWFISSYRGKYLVNHHGGIDGFTSILVLLPYEGVGVVLLANKNLSSLPSYLSLEFVDRLLELPFIDWMQEGKEGLIKAKKGMEEKHKQEDYFRKKNTTPSHSLEDYVGSYFHPGYGEAIIDLTDQGLSFTLHGITSFLDHWHYDVFQVKEVSEEMLLSREGMKLQFGQNMEGAIDQLLVPLEVNASEIVFKKRSQDHLLEREYLSKFLGFYEIYGYTVEIALKNGQLTARIPSMPVYELIPIAENEFSVKSMAGYSLRFLMSAKGAVEEALLVQPYGAIVAKPKRKC